ncbi:MAG: EFR1 family ferrodoxin [Sphaerochaeta sp.]|jgi:ferredoxin|nr:EFR1 family ferrodoxin [Sphaerochaeta sp.]MCH3918984.1 EFR1 family ferrodoxin [Sphaerochaeta sp.]MCI2045363.1 EFR1 family ferrodoxin [Sphaerochaeta sp.]MCI2075756.1 EFR1 family ferrodoxin [Sphaerochaeta sp.]MCI2097117.1 EFR1 family ferrodoxin [Sphaerochaeta sp.]
MQTTLFVYSATGNSYYVARKIADALGETTIVLLPHSGPVEITERIGIISPIYSWVTPRVTSEFITSQLSQTNLKDIGYLFCIHTYGGLSGYAPMGTEMLLQNIGCLSSYQNTVKLPDTYVPLFSIATGAKYEAIYDKADRKIQRIIQDIKAEKIRPSMKLPLGKSLKNVLAHISYEEYRSYGERLSASDACIRCGKCVRLCPNKNITQTDGGKPQFGPDCLACFACLLGCPVSAIGYGPHHKTASYPNPRSGFDAIRK